MQINKVRIINFRNINKAELEFNSAFKFFVFFGSNGAGKTSILEALSLINSPKGMLHLFWGVLFEFVGNYVGYLSVISPAQNPMINVEYLRWLYTAITRAKKELYLVNFSEQFYQS